MDGNRGIDGCHLSPVQGMPAGSVLSQTGAKKGGCVHIPCSGGRGSAAIGIHRSSRSIRRLCCVCRRVQRTSTFESLRSGRERESTVGKNLAEAGGLTGTALASNGATDLRYSNKLFKKFNILSLSLPRLTASA